MIDNYNLIAPVYDCLSRLIYGKKLLHAQLALLHLIPEGATICLVGGGTGQLLEKFPSSQKPYKIYYVERSKAMLDRAKRRNHFPHQVTFIHSSILDIKQQIDCDVVITPFLFDNFAEAEAKEIFWKIHSLTRPQSYWINTDFYIDHRSKKLHKILLQCMYRFFRCVAGIQANSLFPMNYTFQQARFELTHERQYMNGFIRTQLYQKKYDSK
jgi:ubiquinone/menaquinone biosynthesis C-methylase UbiE